LRSWLPADPAIAHKGEKPIIHTLFHFSVKFKKLASPLLELFGLWLAELGDLEHRAEDTLDELEY
jgi:hypothetical protein